MTDDELQKWARDNSDAPEAKAITAHFAQQWSQSSHGNALQRLDNPGAAMGPFIKGGLATVGGAVAGPVGAGLGNAAGGMLDRAAGGTQGGPASDFLWGYGPQKLLQGAGSVMRSYGRPALAKAVGYFMGKPTQEAAAGGGPNLDYVTNPQLQRILGADTPAGAQKIGSEMAQNANAQLQPAMYGPRSVGTIEPTINARGNVSFGQVETPMSTPMSEVRMGQIADNAGQLDAFSAKPSGLSSAVEAIMGHVADGPGKWAARAMGASGSPAAARYLSAAAQASQRGLPLTPELEQMLQNAPGQQMASPTLSQLIRSYGQGRQ